MSTSSLTYTQTANLRPLVVLALLVLLAATVAYGTHAVARHGDDAHAIRDCLERQGPTQVWKSRSPYEPNRFWLLCEEGGRWGVMLVERVRGALHEVTTFVPKDGSWPRVLEYISARATRFMGQVLP